MSAYEWTATAICITGTVLNVWRINFCFAMWAVGEIMWSCFDLNDGAYSRLMLDGLGLFFALVGAGRNGLGLTPKKGTVK